MLRKAAEVDEVRADSIEANLQVVIPSGRRVDLELVGRAAGGDVVRVWIEAKWMAVFQRDQLLDYERALGDRGTLIAVVPAARTIGYGIVRRPARPRNPATCSGTDPNLPGPLVYVRQERAQEVPGNERAVVMP